MNKEGNKEGSIRKGDKEGPACRATLQLHPGKKCARSFLSHGKVIHVLLLEKGEISYTSYFRRNHVKQLDCLIAPMGCGCEFLWGERNLQQMQEKQQAIKQNK